MFSEWRQRRPPPPRTGILRSTWAAARELELAHLPTIDDDALALALAPRQVALPPGRPHGGGGEEDETVVLCAAELCRDMVGQVPRLANYEGGGGRRRELPSAL